MIEINYKLLNDNNYNNQDLIIRLKLEEDQKNINDKEIFHYYEKKKIIENKYNTQHELNKLNTEYTKQLDIMKKEYDIEYKNLQEEFNKLDIDRRRKIITNDNYKVEIDILNNTIFTKKNYKITLQIQIVKLETQINNKRKLCNKKLEDIDLDYRNILLKYIHNQSPCVVGGSIKSYEEISDKIVEDKIKKLEKINNSFDVKKYIINEEEYEKNHNNIINEEKENIKNKLINITKFYTLELDNINNLISYYKKLKKLNSVETIMKLIDKLNNNIVRLENDINKLEEKYTLLNNTKNSYDIICQKKINKLNCHKYKLI